MIALYPSVVRSSGLVLFSVLLTEAALGDLRIKSESKVSSLGIVEISYPLLVLLFLCKKKNYTVEYKEDGWRLYLFKYSSVYEGNAPV